MGGAWKQFARERLPYVAGSLGLNGLMLFLFALAFGHKLPPAPPPEVFEVDIVELPIILPPEPEPEPE
ncbi:MAG TPA: hypothetical protein DDX09_01905, partial [Hyphomonas atlantica]|nr:hypothetical protein [Hyphomonas atlantica]